MEQIKIAAFSGSLRKGSYTTKLVKAFQRSAPENVEVNIIDISALPLFNQDLEENLPGTVKALHQSIEEADGIILATPEYNRSYSPVLKNALDWGSRPHGNNKWDKKPVIVLGCSPYSLGAFGAVHHLRQVLVYLNMQPVQQPEFYLSGAADKLGDNGEIKDLETKELVNKLWKEFTDLINTAKQAMVSQD